MEGKAGQLGRRDSYNGGIKELLSNSLKDKARETRMEKLEMN